MLSRDRMPQMAQSPCRRCGEMCDSAVITWHLGKSICHECLAKETGVHFIQSRILGEGECYVCNEFRESAIVTRNAKELICRECLNKQVSIYRNPAKTLHQRDDYIPVDPPKPRRLSQYTSSDGQGVYFYAYGLDDPENIWIDPGAIELFLKCLYLANEKGISVYRFIVRESGVSDFLDYHWFIDPQCEEYVVNLWVGKFQDD